MKKDELIKRLYTYKVIGDKDLMQILEEAGFKDYAISSIINKIADITNYPSPPVDGAEEKFRDVLNEVQRLIEINDGATGGELRAIWNNLSFAITQSERRPLPPAEGAEERRATAFEAVDFLYSKGCGNENLSFNHDVELLAEFATLHAQRLAEKMVEEKLKKEYERGIEDGKIIGEHGSVSYIE